MPAADSPLHLLRQLQAGVAELGPDLASALQLVAESALRLSGATRIEIDAGDIDAAVGVGGGEPFRVPLHVGRRLVGELRAYESNPDAEDALRLVSGIVVSALADEYVADANARYRETFARLQAVYDNSPVGIGLIAPDGIWIDVNETMTQLLDVPRDAWLGRSSTAWVPAEHSPQIRESFRKLLLGEIDSYDVEFEVVTAARRHWLRSSISLVRTCEGQPDFAIAITEDVTAQKERDEHLLQAQRMEAVGALAAGIAHDFNNLLMGVIGHANLSRAELEHDVPGSGVARRVDDHLARIEEVGNRAATLTRQLLAFARRQTLHSQDVDLNGLVLEMVSMLERVLGEHIRIDSQLGGDLPPLHADPTQLQHVLLNLALNARDAMPDGGALTIATEAIDISAEDESHDGLTPGRYVLLRVEDTGIGMSEDVRERIFEPFFTTKDVGRGTGLGLASVYGIIKQSEGGISVVSSPGAGSTFRIFLPTTSLASRVDGAFGDEVSVAGDGDRQDEPASDLSRRAPAATISS